MTSLANANILPMLSSKRDTFASLQGRYNQYNRMGVDPLHRHDPHQSEGIPLRVGAASHRLTCHFVPSRSQTLRHHQRLRDGGRTWPVPIQSSLLSADLAASFAEVVRLGAQVRDRDRAEGAFVDFDCKDDPARIWLRRFVVVLYGQSSSSVRCHPRR